MSRLACERKLSTNYGLWFRSVSDKTLPLTLKPDKMPTTDTPSNNNKLTQAASAANSGSGKGTVEEVQMYVLTQAIRGAMRFLGLLKPEGPLIAVD